MIKGSKMIARANSNNFPHQVLKSPLTTVPPGPAYTGSMQNKKPMTKMVNSILFCCFVIIYNFESILIRLIALTKIRIKAILDSFEDSFRGFSQIKPVKANTNASP